MIFLRRIKFHWREAEVRETIHGIRVAFQLLQDLPPSLLQSYFFSLKDEISIAVDALPGTLAQLLSLGCSSRNHRSFLYYLLSEGGECLPCTALMPSALARGDGHGYSSDPPC